MESHLLQMRGLKRHAMTAKELNDVASFTDAWIETANPINVLQLLTSHLLQMRGLKPPTSGSQWILPFSRIFYRCVD